MKIFDWFKRVLNDIKEEPEAPTETVDASNKETSIFEIEKGLRSKK